MRLLTLSLLVFFSLSLSAQNVDEELGFIYVKADYLLETNRYDEAIKEFTKIIAKDPSFKDALYKRADAKFNVGAFQGTYNDLLQSFEAKGITPEAVLLYGKAQKNLGKADAAAQTMETAGLLYPNGTSAREKAEKQKAETAEDKDPVEAMKDKISSILEDLLPGDGTTEKTDENGGTTTGTPDRTNDNSGSSSEPNDRQTKGQPNTKVDLGDKEEPVEIEPAVDNSINEIYVDEDVTLEIKNGLGARKVLQQPSILILSETSGNVVIDLCVNGNGKVTQAEFNQSESSLRTQSIISLAVRKSKEFWFKSSTANETCGTIVYRITGSN